VGTAWSKMGLGSYVICELASVKREHSVFQRALAALEEQIIAKCNAEWAPKTFGYLTPKNNQYGRTTILPPLFKNAAGTQLVTWRFNFTSTGHQLIMAGARAGNTIPEDFKVALVGFAFPNPTINISEIKMQIGDTKFGRINLEELKSYEVPALVFEEGFIIDEETSFELYGYIEQTGYQRIVPLGACYYKVIDKVLGAPGSAI